MKSNQSLRAKRSSSHSPYAVFETVLPTKPEEGECELGDDDIIGYAVFSHLRARSESTPPSLAPRSDPTPHRPFAKF